MNKHNEVLALINEIKLGKQSKIEEFYFPVVTTTILTYFYNSCNLSIYSN